MNKWLEILIGLVLIIIAIYAWGINILGVGTAALELLKGGILWIIILVGAIFLLLGISDLKD
jgi:hypothetical protein